MKAAVIAPTRVLTKYAITPDRYHLTLAHLILSDPFYCEFYSYRARAGDFVILDNSAHEFGVGMMLESLLKAAKMIRPNEIVLPDRLFFGDDTAEMSKAVALSSSFASLGFPVSFMVCPQGRTIEEWLVCLDELMKLPRVTSIGISKDYEGWPGGLKRLVKITRRLAPSTPIHLLGWGREGWQLHEIASDPDMSAYIRGVDTAKPLVYAQSGIKMGTHWPKYPRRSEKFFDLKESDFDDDTARHNLRFFFEQACSLSILPVLGESVRPR